MRVEAWFAITAAFPACAILEIGRDPGRPETVIAELGGDAGRGAPANERRGLPVTDGMFHCDTQATPEFNDQHIHRMSFNRGQSFIASALIILIFLVGVALLCPRAQALADDALERDYDFALHRRVFEEANAA